MAVNRGSDRKPRRSGFARMSVSISRERGARPDAPDAQAAAVKPVQRTCAAQQKQFDAFRLEYNTARRVRRRHAGLALRRLAAAAAPDAGVPRHFLVKRVTDAGTFRLQQRLLYIANALVNQHIGLEETDDGVWAIYFNPVLLATLDERDFVIRG